MDFHSIAYIMFLPTVVVLHWLCPHRFRWIVLLCGSYVFYAAWRVDFLSLLLISTVVDYCAGRSLDEEKDQRKRKIILWSSVSVNLSLLFIFKYTETIWNTFITLFTNTPGVTLQPIDLILPLGISFYTFQTLSYTIDVYRRRIPAERHLGMFALYVAFFPQLLAGPIERASKLLGQLNSERRFQWALVGPAVFLILLGLAKKLVIADRLGMMLAPIIDEPSLYDPWVVLITPAANVYRFYCDLSGYADVAIGSAMLLGIELSKNFNRPFAATSTMQFWYSWHITVTNWFRDYVLRHFSKQGSVGTPRHFAMLLTGMLIGMWHGLTPAWLIAGFSISLFAIPEARWRRWRIRNDVRPRNRLTKALWAWSGRLYVWGLVFFVIGPPLAWEGSGHFMEAVSQVSLLASPEWDHSWKNLPFSKFNATLVLGSLFALEVWQWAEAKGFAGRMQKNLNLPTASLLLTLLALYTMMFGAFGSSGFLYYRF